MCPPLCQGKRLRPRLVLASAAACSPYGIGDGVLQAAAAIQLVHAGSLLHDDIVDRCETRRGKPTLAAVHGLRSALLAGNCALQAALEVVSVLPEWARRRTAEVAVQVSTGQYREIVRTFDIRATVDDRIDVMALKTAAVFELASELGAALAGVDQEQCNKLREFGKSFGMLFQIADDADDLLSGSEEQGRTPGVDMRQGVMSLPLVLVPSGDFRRQLESLLSSARDGEGGDLTNDCATIVRNSGALDRLRHIALQYAERCRLALLPLPASAASGWLESLTTGALNRITRYRHCGRAV